MNSDIGTIPCEPAPVAAIVQVLPLAPPVPTVTTSTPMTECTCGAEASGLFVHGVGCPVNMKLTPAPAPAPSRRGREVGVMHPTGDSLRALCGAPEHDKDPWSCFDASLHCICAKLRQAFKAGGNAMVDSPGWKEMADKLVRYEYGESRMVLAERERCAQVCEGVPVQGVSGVRTMELAAARIRWTP
jgi:hypothetical protein